MLTVDGRSGGEDSDSRGVRNSSWHADREIKVSFVCDGISISIVGDDQYTPVAGVHVVLLQRALCVVSTAIILQERLAYHVETSVVSSG